MHVDMPRVLSISSPPSLGLSMILVRAAFTRNILPIIASKLVIRSSWYTKSSTGHHCLHPLVIIHSLGLTSVKVENQWQTGHGVTRLPVFASLQITLWFSFVSTRRDCFVPCEIFRSLLLSNHYYVPLPYSKARLFSRRSIMLRRCAHLYSAASTDRGIEIFRVRLVVLEKRAFCCRCRPGYLQAGSEHSGVNLFPLWLMALSISSLAWHAVEIFVAITMIVRSCREEQILVRVFERLSVVGCRSWVLYTSRFAVSLTSHNLSSLALGLAALRS